MSDITRLYENFQTTLSSNLQQIQLNLRSIGQNCRQQFLERFNVNVANNQSRSSCSASNNNNDTNSLNSSNAFIDSTSDSTTTDQSVPSSPTISSALSNVNCDNGSSSTTNTANTTNTNTNTNTTSNLIHSSNNNSQRSSHHQRNSNRSSSTWNRRHHHNYYPSSSSSLCGDHNRNAYQLYRNSNGLISIRTLDSSSSSSCIVKDNRNVLAAILSVIVLIILANALAQPKWFSIYNDLCAPPRYLSGTSDDPNTKSDSENYLNGDTPSIFDFQSNQYTQYRPQFYYSNDGIGGNGPLQSIYSNSYSLAPVTIYGLTPDYKTCANSQILALKRTIIGLCFLAIMSTLVQFFMDIMGTKRKWVNSIRQYAMGNILCVLICVSIIGISYLISVLYERLQLQQLFSKQHHQSSTTTRFGTLYLKSSVNRLSMDNTHQMDYLTIHQIEVKFELSYYLITLAGFLSIVASAANLFRRPKQIIIERISQVNHTGTNHYHHHRSFTNHRQLRAINNGLGDQSALLGSESIDSPTGTTTTANGLYLPPPPPPPCPSYSSSSSPPPPPPSTANDWIFNANWTLMCSAAAAAAASANNSSGALNQNSTNRHLPPILPSSCPPPPPYSP